MQLQDILFTVESEFKNNWAQTPVHFESGKKADDARTWIHLLVRALSSADIGYSSGCTLEKHMIYVTCYAPNQVKAAALADSVAVFIENRNLGDFFTQTAEPIHQADVSSDTYFYRIGIPIRN